jgi:RNA polymerase sigma-70 factor (ECF subfamily)
MRVRRLSRRREISTEDAVQPSFTDRGHFAEPQAPWSQSVEAEVGRAEDKRVVHEAIAQLPDNYREALLLRDIEQLSNEELAAELGVTVNAAKIRVHRARQALRELLHPHMSEAGS